MKNQGKKGVFGAFFFAVIGFSAFLSPSANGFVEGADDLIASNESDTVEELSATAGNGSVILIWSAKYNDKDEEAKLYRVNYGTKSVQKGDAETYDANYETIDNVPSVKIDDLENNIPYFFSVIAVFDDDSETFPSDESTATPISDLQQEISETPVVISAESTGKKKIRILFSEDVTLPEENPELAFTIAEEQNENILLEVVGAKYDTDIESGEKVLSDIIVSTSELQEEGKTYRVTVSAQITDAEGNSIESGSTDSAVFSTFEGEEEPEVAEEEENSKIDINALLGEGENNEEEDELSLDDILSELDEEDIGEAGEDTTSPEDITGLVTSFTARLTDYLVSLSWRPSANTDDDLDDQLLYRSEDRGDQWSIGVSLGKNTTKTNIPEQPETEVTYKITVKDVAGNESVGVIRSVSLPALPATGGGLLIAAGFALAGAGMRRWRRKD